MGSLRRSDGLIGLLGALPWKKVEEYYFARICWIVACGNQASSALLALIVTWIFSPKGLATTGSMFALDWSGRGRR
jgi:cytochrome bd-type quinol oxidase subunit 1